MIDFYQAIILGLIEGLSEFLPISSTAHLIVGELLLSIKPSPFLNFFTGTLACRERPKSLNLPNLSCRSRSVAPTWDHKRCGHC
jgi:hypothetical protein